MGDLAVKLTQVKTRIEALRDHYVPPFAVETTEKDWSWLALQMQKIPTYQPNWSAPDGMKWLMLDGKYYAPSYEAMNAIWGWDWVDKKRYYADKFDCENFAALFQAHCALFFGVNTVAFVIDYSGGHGFNLIFFQNGDIMVFEPQNDTGWGLVDNPTGGIYQMRNGFILV